MQHKERHEIIARDAIASLDKIAYTLSELSRMMLFVQSWDDDQGMFYGYAISITGEVNHHIHLVREKIKHLESLADPSAPEELPF